MKQIERQQLVCSRKLGEAICTYWDDVALSRCQTSAQRFAGNLTREGELQAQVLLLDKQYEGKK
jgi:hypothetical protein